MNFVNGPYERDVIKSSYIPIDVPHRLANETMKITGDRNPRTLIIGTHPTMEYNVGDVLLWNTEKLRSRDIVIDEPANVVDRLRMMVHQQYRQYSFVLAAYETHHFNPDQLHDALELLRMMSHGSVVVMDYAIDREPKDKVLDMARRKIDADMLKRVGGVDAWVQGHSVYTPTSFANAMEEADWSSMAHFSLPEFGVGFVGSSEFSDDEMQSLAHEALRIRSNAFDILASPHDDNRTSA